MMICEFETWLSHGLNLHNIIISVIYTSQSSTGHRIQSRPFSQDTMHLLAVKRLATKQLNPNIGRKSEIRSEIAQSMYVYWCSDGSQIRM